MTKPEDPHGTHEDKIEHRENALLVQILNTSQDQLRVQRQILQELKNKPHHHYTVRVSQI